MSGSSVGRAGFAEATAPRKPSVAEQLRWVKERVPDEVPSFALAAAWVVAYRGDTPTAESVRAQLVAEGKTKAQLKEQAA